MRGHESLLEGKVSQGHYTAGRIDFKVNRHVDHVDCVMDLEVNLDHVACVLTWTRT